MRLFLAVSPDEACRARLARDLAPLREGSRGVRWVREEHLHVTLSFLGEVDAGTPDNVVREVAPAVGAHAHFSAALAGGGVFPGWRRPRVLWLGFADPEPIGRLGADVAQVCASLGFIADREFRPHLTIGRVTRDPGPDERARLEQGLMALPGPYRFDVTRVDLMRSELGTGGPRHSVIHGLPLGPA